MTLFCPWKYFKQSKICFLKTTLIYVSFEIFRVNEIKTEFTVCSLFCPLIQSKFVLSLHMTHRTGKAGSGQKWSVRLAFNHPPISLSDSRLLYL